MTKLRSNQDVLQKGEWQAGLVVHTCNPTTLGGWSKIKGWNPAWPTQLFSETLPKMKHKKGLGV